MEFLCVVFAALPIVAIVAVVQAAIQQQKELAAALQAYQAGLERLKADPNNPELRQQVLQLGRAYSNLTRQKRGVTVYDEVALKNDIDAACAGAVSVQKASIEERLATLQKLHEAGHISADEYHRRRQAVLDEV